MEPFTFNAIRFALGAASIAILMPVLRTLGLSRRHREHDTSPGATLRAGVLAGLVLFAGAGFQQWGLVYTTAGKAAFITGLYVVIVQAIAWLIGQRPPAQAGIGGMLGLLGLYLLSLREAFTMSPGDGLELIGSFFWACHVLVIGKVSPRTDALSLSLIQFTVCTVLNAVLALATEQPRVEGVLQAALPLLYGGILSVGVAFTLQVFSQKKAHPGHAAVILSSEAAFGALLGWVFLSELLSPRALLGCGLMLAGVIVAQVPQSLSAPAPLKATPAVVASREPPP